MKYGLWAWGQLKRGFEVLELGEMCFEGTGAVEKGFFFYFIPNQSETVLSYNTSISTRPSRGLLATRMG